MTTTAEYHRKYRAEHPEYVEKSRMQQRAYRQALLRLKDLHPGKFKMLYAEERARDAGTASQPDS